jgi:hypothetical protein
VGLFLWTGGDPALILFKRINGRRTCSVTSASCALGAGTQLELTIKGSNRAFMECGVVRFSATDYRLAGGAPRIMAVGAAVATTGAAAQCLIGPYLLGLGTVSRSRVPSCLTTTPTAARGRRRFSTRLAVPCGRQPTTEQRSDHTQGEGTDHAEEPEEEDGILRPFVNNPDPAKDRA